MGSNFEELNVWKEACSLAVAVYKTVQDCKDFALKDQIQRAAVSIPSNIAEGAERQSGKEFIHFLFINISSKIILVIRWMRKIVRYCCPFII